MPDIINSETIIEQIQSAAEGPAEVSGDAGSVKQFALSDLIAAHKYLKANEAGARRTSGLRFSRLVPPGAVTRGWGS